MQVQFSSFSEIFSLNCLPETLSFDSTILECYIMRSKCISEGKSLSKVLTKLLVGLAP